MEWKGRERKGVRVKNCEVMIMEWKGKDGKRKKATGEEEKGRKGT